MTFTEDQVHAAVLASATAAFPFPESEGTLQMLSDAILPALEDLPPHHDCAKVREALMAVFAMGVAVGAELERAA